MRFLPMETISFLIEGFLANPHVEISLSDSKAVLQLRHDMEVAEQEAVRCQALYGREVVRCLKYEDYLGSIGVNPAAIK